MNEIIEKRRIAEAVYLIRLMAPEIAKSRRPGQFVIFRIDDKGERVPLTVADADPEQGTITIVFQVVGESTRQLSQMEPGEFVSDVAGPLGKPTHVEHYGHVVCIGGGLGIALIWPIAKALRAAGNRVTSIISARNESLLIMQDEMGACSDRLEVATDDGSKGFHGYPTQVLQEMIDAGEQIDIVFAVGPVPAMAAVCRTTEPCGLKTIVSLNPIMVDGTGMCGGCRVTVGGKTRFVCVDGPEFDGHQVDFKELSHRLAIYPAGEKKRSDLTFTHRSGQCEVAVKKAEEDGKRLPRQPMPEQDPKTRAGNFDEVPYGFTPELAQAEASRCLQCKKPKCVEGCPVNVKIPEFIKLIAEGEFVAAARKIKETNSLPAICGRVCPQEEQCENVCVLGRKGDPVAIGNLERFASDKEREEAELAIPQLPPATGKKVAIVGAGPAGLTAAGDLAKMGHAVTIYEALHKAGGVLVYGIPEFRLPKAIVDGEVDYLRKLGVGVKLNSVIGKVCTVEDLLADYDAVFLGTGAGLPLFLGIPGENFNGVMSANEYLTRTNLMKAFDADHATPILKKDRVAVIGGGNVAMDSARTALRLGAESVYLVYRRSRAEMPAREAEIHHGEQEGIDFRLLTNPVRILGTEDGWVAGMECMRMELGEPDASGRRRPIPIDGSEFLLDVDLVVVAIGNGPHPLVPQTTPDMQVSARGNIVADESTGATTKAKVFAGGDIVTGAATVISAMGAGKRAAEAINDLLTK